MKNKINEIITPEFRQKLNKINPKLEKLILKPVNQSTKKAINELKSRFIAFKYWIVRNERKAVDDMLFKYENLPPFTKEYWFLHLNGMDPKLPRQIILAFIKFSSGARGNNMDLTKKPGIACWLFDKRKQIIAELATDINITKKKISSPIFCFEGTYPNYSLTILKKGKKICDLAFSEPKIGEKYKFSSNFIGPLGFEHINLYLDFKGTLNSRRISGKSLVQKVIATTPFLPWYWGHIHFNDGSRMAYFLPQLDILGIKYRIRSSLKFKHPDGRVTNLRDFEIKKSGDWWELHTADNKFFIKMKAYTSSKFMFESIGKFHYKEYFVEVTDFYLKDDRRTISMDKLGHGSGLVEEAYGFTF